MGAFIAYLHQAEGIDNFFVLAPNLTIYNKRIADFTPNRPKYVFKGIVEAVNVADVVRETTDLYRGMSIDLPKISVVPRGDMACRYEDFDMDVRNINLQPVAEDILIQHLHDNHRFHLRDRSGIIEEKRREDYLVRSLIDFDDIDYAQNAELLYKLAGQVVTRLRTYLANEVDIVTP